MIFQRGFHGAQTGALRTHIAQTIHRPDDLLLHLFGSVLHFGKRRFPFGKLRFDFGKRVRRALHIRAFGFDLRAQRFDAIQYALPAHARGFALRNQTLLFLFNGGNAFAHHAHRALARFHLANQILHLIALFGGLQLQFGKVRLAFLAGCAQFFQFAVRA